MTVDRREFLAVVGSALAAIPAEATKAAGRPFPTPFLWGAATAAHQVEGQNVNADYWVLEHLNPSPFREPSGDACDSWNRHASDVALAARLGLSAYRFSIEWARIEPEPGEYSAATLAYYRRLLAACHEHGLTPVVTYHHFTSPRWFAALGGWEAPGAADHFVRYAERATRAMGDLIGYVCTFNEANQPSLPHILRGDRPRPEEAAVRAMAARAVGSDRFGAYGLGDPFAIRDAMLNAHARARDAIRAVRPGLPVGQTLALQALEAGQGGEALLARVVRETRAPFYESARQDDFIGVQTYLRQRLGPDGVLPVADGAPRNAAGEDIWPDALETTVREVARASSRPVLVTEHGVNTLDDAQRIDFIDAAVHGLRRVIDDGITVRGYIHWSLLDNFEWLQGYGPRFGLCAVDRTTFVRTPKPSAAHLGRIARNNGSYR